ncbi:ATP-binding protein [Acidaminobacter sp.]|uniref:ATP-binding protein n=1 Tax=Acidaminobacter sp. TaxID=1872102 RepID=UPI0025660432|nr:ATP-binding protein [Acidaminobacter sp.]MDK9711714.1 ATP-binding protein [Acidaminobacter sp.]
MVQRKQYLGKLKKLKDKKIIKVVTGIRRCGKSTLLLMFQEYLKECGVEDNQIITINFEDIANEPLLDYRKLHDHVTKNLHQDKMAYVFLDEIQNVPQFQKAVDSLFIKDNVDVYITGSNAQLLSGELATLLSGRYIEIAMLPLSFAEYYEMVGGNQRDAWNNYFKNGGFPYAAVIEEEEIRREYLMGIYNSVLLKDVVARKRISDIPLLESVIKFLFDNIGSIVSSKKIADSLTTYGRKTTSVTVENYIEALTEAFILYKAGRYDVKGKQYLKSLEKYYLVDVGLRRMLLGDRSADLGHILENIVYLELLRRGNKVSIGKIDNNEIDFVAEFGGDRVYYQVAASILDPATFEREIAPLKKIADHYPKFILSLDELPMGDAGIKQVNIVDFLLGN